MSGVFDEFERLARRADEVFARHGVRLTIGGEPTFVPDDPQGDEWHHAAVGPDKLRAAWAMARHLQVDALPQAAIFFSPGKAYPGEDDPRWSIWILARRDGHPLFRAADSGTCSTEPLAAIRSGVCNALGLADTWRRFADPLDAAGEVWAILLDGEGDGGNCNWATHPWPAEAVCLLRAAGPAGLRLPLTHLPEGVPRRALVIERRGERMAVFLPPLLQPTFLRLLDVLSDAVRRAGIAGVELEGTIPPDDAGLWTRIGLAADPGVLEVNLPACESWRDYDHWLRAVSDAAAAAGLRPWRRAADGGRGETGGGNHLLWGGPALDENPFFLRPAWIASILRYWQRHPSLSYLFSGPYLGPCSQAPRADESGHQLHDLQWTWDYLTSLPPGDRRQEIAEALRHLQADATGNGHRTEISFDKFWAPDVPGGGQGLIEFRAVAMMPEAAWSSSIVLLWSALAAWLLENGCEGQLRDHGRALHDRFFLPTVLWHDLEAVFADLRNGGFSIPAGPYRNIWEWRFPVVLDFRDGDARLTIRRAGEHWPTLIEAPPGGGTTSRFVDSSLRRLEFVADEAFAATWRIEVNGRPVLLCPLAGSPTARIAGLRYRHSRLHPCLHPGIPPHLPLGVSLIGPDCERHYLLDDRGVRLEEVPGPPSGSVGVPCRPIHPDELTLDLRFPPHAGPA